MNLSEKEERIYDELFKLRKGDYNDREIAFEVMGWLGNESLNVPFDERLDFVEKIMREYKEKKDSGTV